MMVSKDPIIVKPVWREKKRHRPQKVDTAGNFDQRGDVTCEKKVPEPEIETPSPGRKGQLANGRSAEKKSPTLVGKKKKALG